MKKNETHQEQVTRILNEMVLHGEVVTKLAKNGELLYALAAPVTAVKKQIKKCRSAAALKAWDTRRKTTAVKKSKNKPKSTSAKRKQAALKAWATRRNQAAKLKENLKRVAILDVRHEAAKKAWVTRRLKAAGNPEKRTARLQLAKKVATNKTSVKYKVRKSAARERPDYVSFDQHLDRAWTAYEESLKKALLRNKIAE